MLGLLGLIGMNIKNAIVLVDEIGLQLNAGLSPVNAVIEANENPYRSGDDGFRYDDLRYVAVVG